DRRRSAERLRRPAGRGTGHRDFLSHHGQPPDDHRMGPGHGPAAPADLLRRNRADRERSRDRPAPERGAASPGDVRALYPEVFHFGILHIRSYGLLLAVAFLVGTWLGLKEARRLGL